MEPEAERTQQQSGNESDTAGMSRKPAVDELAFLAPPESPDEIGRLKHYRVLRVLGRGGMGMVFQAEDTKLRRQVALKVMLPEIAQDPLARQRFFREARAQAAVEHDHIIPIFHIEEESTTPYITMPLLRGETLASALRRHPLPPLKEVVRIGREIAEGLAAAHERSLIHRDIKPGNIWLEGGPARNRVKILDFGLARSVQRSRTDEPLTSSGAVLGTPAYMAPEQAAGRAVDFRTDLFSLGIMLYQMTTGELPFKGEDVYSILTALAIEVPPPVISKNATIPLELSQLIDRLLSKNPADRPGSARSVADTLSRIEQGLSGTIEVTPRSDANPWSAIALTEIDTTSSRTLRVVESRAKKSVPPWVWVALAGVILLGGTALLFQLIRVQTPRGTLVIDVDPNARDVEVTIKPRGKAELKTKDRELVLEVGEYGIELTDKLDGLRLNTREFRITRDNKTTVRVSLEAPRAAEKPTAAVPALKAKTDGLFTFMDAVAGVSTIHGASEEQVKRWSDNLPRRFRPTWVSARYGSKETRLDAVATAFPNDTPWLLQFIADHEDQANFDTMYPTHRPVFTYDFWNRGVRLWLKEDSNVAKWCGERDWVVGKLKEAQKTRFLATSLAAQHINGNYYLDTTVGPEEGNFDYHLNLTEDELRKKIDEYRNKDWIPYVLQVEFGSAPLQYLALFRENNDRRDWDFSLALSAADYEKMLSEKVAKKQRPRCVTSYESDGQIHYTIIWEAIPEAKN